MAQTGRGRCWSITINNPADEEVKVPLLPGWKLEGQYERGEEGTRHFQGMLTTPTVRFHQVKSTFPRAHIEVAKNKKALVAYVHKDDSRIGEFATRKSPSIFELQVFVASLWDWKEFEMYQATYPRVHTDDLALMYSDSIVSRLIVDGYTAVEFIAVNPMWRTSWKKFYRSIIKRYASSLSTLSSQTESELCGNGGTDPTPSQGADNTPECLPDEGCETDRGEEVRNEICGGTDP